MGSKLLLKHVRLKPKCASFFISLLTLFSTEIVLVQIVIVKNNINKDEEYKNLCHNMARKSDFENDERQH